ncbi:MAG: IPTL-CTERM sorting domain-containing protein, partial [Saprospiraceae bacterium]|nr:IPTL-CTERM sorting domain-containing protein [Saprospiraceae bacterium]
MEQVKKIAALPPNSFFKRVVIGMCFFVFLSMNQTLFAQTGITWTARMASEANSWLSVTYGGGQFVAVSLDGTNLVMTSPDGITWTARMASEANSWTSVTYGGGKFVAVSIDGTNRVMTSGALALPVPTLSQWSLIILGLFLSIIGITALR